MKNVSPSLNISDLERIGAFKVRTYEGTSETLNDDDVWDRARIRLVDRYHSRHGIYSALKYVDIICGEGSDSMRVTPDKEINVEHVTLEFCGIRVQLTVGQACELKDQLAKVNI